MKVAIISVSKKGYELSIKLKKLLDSDSTIIKCDVYHKDVKNTFNLLFYEYDSIIAIMASGILIRSISHLIKSKTTDPAILNVDDNGNFVISMLSGHLGGANKLTLKIADLIDATAVITTSTDVNKKLGIDVLAKDLYLSIEQKEIGGYHEVYAGGKTRDGNDSVEIQLETRNVEIQTDLEMQKIISGRKGIYNKEEMDKEAELHSEHGDDEEKMPIENVDGDAHTRVACDSPYVPDTEITWEQFSKLLGKEDIEEIIEEFFEQYNGKNGHELILRMQAEYRANETEKELEKVEDHDIDRIDEEYVHIVITEETQVPGKNMTVKEWAEELGESTTVIVARLQREVDKDDERQPKEIVEEIEADYERAGHEHKH